MLFFPFFTMMLAFALCIIAPSASGIAAERGQKRLSLPDPGAYIRTPDGTPTPIHKNTLAGQRESFRLDCARALKGDPDAAFRVANRLQIGFGIERDQHAALAWRQMAAVFGHAKARQQVQIELELHKKAPPVCLANLRATRLPDKAPEQLSKLVKDLSPQHGLDPNLVLTIIKIESGFRVDAISSKNAMGLMQLMPLTAERFGVRDAFNPEENVTGGIRYLKWLLAYFQGDVLLAVAAYNAGERAIDRYGGVPPYPETQVYLKSFQSIYTARAHPFDGMLANPSPILSLRSAALLH